MSNGMKVLVIMVAVLVLGVLFTGVYGSGWMGFGHHGSGHHGYESHRDSDEECYNGDEECEMEGNRGSQAVDGSCH